MKIDKKYLYVLILFLLSAALYFPGLGNRDLWNPNEPNFAEATREMIESGDYLVPTRNGVPLGMKPAPYYWFIILSSKVTGSLNETAARLPSAVSALFIVLFTFLFARRIMDEEGALIAALVLATVYKFMWQARWVEADMVLTLFVTLSLYFFYLGISGEKKKRLFYLLGYTFAAVATLSKGLVGFVLIGVVLFSYIAVTRNFKKIMEMEIILGPIIFFAITISWYLTAGVSGGGEYTYDLVIKHNFIRFFNAFNHKNPFYYYLPVIIGDFTPYSLFLPGALIFAFKTDKVERREKLAFFMTWFISIFIFLSISDAKRGNYILPLYPAAAIIVGWLLYRWVKDDDQRWYYSELPAWVMTVTLIVSVVATALFLFNPFDIFSRPYSEILEVGLDRSTIVRLSVPVVIFLAVGASTLVVALKSGRKRLFIFATVAIVALSMLYAQLAIFPKIDSYKSPRVVSESIASMLGPDDGFGGYSRNNQFIWYGYMYYTKRYIDVFDDEEALSEYYREDRRVIVIMRDRDYESLPDEIKGEMETVYPYKVGHKKMVITSNDSLRP